MDHAHALLSKIHHKVKYIDGLVKVINIVVNELEQVIQGTVGPGSSHPSAVRKLISIKLISDVHIVQHKLINYTWTWSISCSTLYNRNLNLFSQNYCSSVTVYKGKQKQKKTNQCSCLEFEYFYISVMYMNTLLITKKAATVIWLKYFWYGIKPLSINQNKLINYIDKFHVNWH